MSQFDLKDLPELPSGAVLVESGRVRSTDWVYNVLYHAWEHPSPRIKACLGTDIKRYHAVAREHRHEDTRR